MATPEIGRTAIINRRIGFPESGKAAAMRRRNVVAEEWMGLDRELWKIG